MSTQHDLRRMILALKPCGCWSIIQTLEDPKTGYEVSANSMAEFWKEVAKRKLKVREFADESWKAIPYQCPVCSPEKFGPKQAELFQ